MKADPRPPPTGLSDLQTWTAATLAGLEHPPLGMAAALAEECGEVSRLMLEHHAYGADLDASALGDELVDVLVCLLEIATHHGIALDQAAERKLSEIARKAPGWRESLGDALGKARGDA